jgi:YVTN family beta-propeller protein
LDVSLSLFRVKAPGEGGLAALHWWTGASHCKISASMSAPRNFRAYFALILLLIFATIIVLREHRPSFLRPNLHLYAYVSTADEAVTIVDLAALRAVERIPVGLEISDLREHSQRDEIWGVSSSGNCVFVLDTRSNQMARIPVGPSPYSLDFSPSGDRVYTTTAGSDQLVAIDTASRQVYGRAHTDGEPVQALVTPDAKNILVVNRRAGTLTIHDRRTLQLLNSIRVIPRPDEVVVNPDSTLAFVMSRTQNRLSVVDLEKAALLTNLELAGTPTQMLMKPDGGELYVVSPDAHGLQAINTWTHEVNDTMLLGSAPSSGVIASDASRMYVSDRGAGRVVPVDVVNRRAGRPIPVGASPNAMRFTLTEAGERPSMLLVIDEASGDLAVIRTRTDSLITLIPIGTGPQRLALKTF